MAEIRAFINPLFTFSSPYLLAHFDCDRTSVNFPFIRQHTYQLSWAMFALLYIIAGNKIGEYVLLKHLVVPIQRIPLAYKR